jgi:cytochrome P450
MRSTHLLRALKTTLGRLAGALNLLAPLRARPADHPPMAQLPGESVPFVGALRRYAGIVGDPTGLAARCLQRYRSPFTLRIPLFFDLTYLPGVEGMRFVLDMDPEVGRMGPVMKRVPTVGYWFPKSDEGEAHLQELLLTARSFMASHLLGSERLARVEATVEQTIATHAARWSGREVDLADVLVRAIYDASIRCMVGEALWSRLGSEVISPLRTIANGIDIPRTTRSVMPGAWLTPEYRATKKLHRVLARVVSEHDENGRFPLVDEIRALSVGGAPLPEADVTWMLMYVLWNAVTYTGTYGLWSYLDMISRPDVLEALRRRDDDRMLEHAFMETLRRNAVASLVRATSKEVVFESNGRSYRVPPGGYVGTFTHALNHDPDVYVEPESYSPERFSRGEPLPHVFGRGAFGCPAGKFTRLMMRALHRTLIDRLDVELTAELPARRCRVHLTYPDRPVMARVSAREPARRAPSVQPEAAPPRAGRCPFHRAA